MSDTSRKTPNKKANKIIAIVCAVVIIAVGLSLLLRGDSVAPGAASKPKHPGVSLYISPSSQTLSKNSDLSLEVWASSGNDNINTVEANLSYSADYFEFQSVDGSGSSFPLAVQGDAKEGVISIVRGTTTPVKGKVLVATVKLHAKDKAGTTKIDFEMSSKLFDSKTNTAILPKTSQATYKIK